MVLCMLNINIRNTVITQVPNSPIKKYTKVVIVYLILI